MKKNKGWLKNKVQMEQAAVKRKKVIVPFLIGLLLLSSIVFIKHLMNRMNSYIEKNGKMCMGAVVEQMQQTYELQTNGYYSQLHLVEGYLLQKNCPWKQKKTVFFLMRGKGNRKVHSCFFRKMVRQSLQTERKCGLIFQVSFCWI